MPKDERDEIYKSLESSYFEEHDKCKELTKVVVWCKQVKSDVEAMIEAGENWNYKYKSNVKDLERAEKNVSIVKKAKKGLIEHI